MIQFVVPEPAHRERPCHHDVVGLYTEDARVRFRGPGITPENT